MHPLFGGIWGISGMIIGVPLMAVIYDIIRQLTRFGLKKRNKEQMMDDYNRAFHAPPEEKKKKGKRG